MRLTRDRHTAFHVGVLSRQDLLDPGFFMYSIKLVEQPKAFLVTIVRAGVFIRPENVYLGFQDLGASATSPW